MALQYRLLHDSAELEQVVDLEIAIWGLDPRDAVPTNIMHVIARYGGLVNGAFHDSQLVGLALALPMQVDGEWILWSHMTGVHPNYQGQGIGLKLKQMQHDWALQHNYQTMRWTFDPLQRGNANFNLHLLGTVADQYHNNLYGSMNDEINADLPSDRLETVWYLNQEQPKFSSHQVEFSLDYLLLRRQENNQPARLIAIDDNAAFWFIEIPANLRLLRLQDARLAYEWRIALREAFQLAFAAGYWAVDFVDFQGRHCYVLTCQKRQ